MKSTLRSSEGDSNKFKLSHYIHLTLFCLRFWYSFSCSTWVCSTVSCSTSFCLYFAHLVLLMFYSTSSSAVLKFVHSILFRSTLFYSIRFCSLSSNLQHLLFSVTSRFQNIMTEVNLLCWKVIPLGQIQDNWWWLKNTMLYSLASENYWRVNLLTYLLKQNSQHCYK